jgi:hypothetical protein
MKTLVALVGSLLCVGPVSAQTTTPAEKTAPVDKAVPADKTTPDSKKSQMRIVLPTKNTPEAKTGPATKAGATKAGEKKKEEPPAKIEGIEIARGEKGFLGIEIVNATFKLSFYDTKKKPIAPDVARATLRWDPKYKVGEERVVLNPAEKSLSSPRNIRPPYNFKLFITLFKEPTEGADPVAVENYTIDFRQEGSASVAPKPGY